MPKYMYIVLSIKSKTQLILESEPTLSEKVGGAGRLFLSSFFKSVGASTRKIRCLQSCSSHPADAIITERNS